LARYVWSSLNNQQVGTFAEYFVKMELTMYGWEVYTSEVDDRGVDFIARLPGQAFLEVQVKALRGSGYVFMQKSKFRLGTDRYLAFALLKEGKEPDLYLIPSLAWQAPVTPFVSRDYDGLRSKPEWGLTVTERSLPRLAPYQFEATLTQLAR
jgi:hypothetical protein